MCPEKGNKAGDKIRRCVLCKVAEDSEFVLEKRVHRGDLIALC